MKESTNLILRLLFTMGVLGVLVLSSVPAYGYECKDAELLDEITNNVDLEVSLAVNPNDPDTMLLATNANHVYVSTDGGYNWSSHLGGLSGLNGYDPTVAIDDLGRMYLVYLDKNSSPHALKVAHSDGLSNWIIDTSITAGGVDKQHITVDPNSNYIYLTWKAGNGEIKFASSSDRGANWVVNTSSISDSVQAVNYNHGPNVQAGPEGNVYIVWAVFDEYDSAGTPTQAIPPDASALGFNYSTDYGSTWSTAYRLPIDVRGTQATWRINFGEHTGWRTRELALPSMAVDQHNGVIHVVWNNLVDTVSKLSDIHYTRNTLNGDSTGWLETPIVVNSEGATDCHQFLPWISIDPETSWLSCFFYDDRSNPDSVYGHPYVAFSFDGGDTWEDCPLDNSTGALVNTLPPGNPPEYVGHVFTAQTSFSAWNTVYNSNESYNKAVNITKYELLEEDTCGYMTLDEIYTYIDGMATSHSGIVASKVSIGTTVEGRSIYAVKISDNHGTNESEPELLYTGGIHADEKLSVEAVLGFMDFLTDNYATDSVGDIVDGHEIWFVPVVNPDGYAYNELLNQAEAGDWRKNRQRNDDGTYGIDLNRNFGYEWEYDDAGSSDNGSDADYRGESAFEALEADALRDFANSRDFIMTTTLHSGGSGVIFPYNYHQLFTPDNDIFEAIGDSIESLTSYPTGQLWNIGFLTQNAEYVANGTAEDWAYGEQTSKDKSFASTFEMYGAKKPCGDTISSAVATSLEVSYFLARISDDPYALRVPAKVTGITAPDFVEYDDGFTVSWSHSDTENPADNFELVEVLGLEYITDDVDNDDYWDVLNMSVDTDRYHSAPSSFFASCYLSTHPVSYIQSPNPYLVETGDTITFWTWYETNNQENIDYAYVEVSTDGIDFVPIEGNLSDVSSGSKRNRGYGFTGSSDGWVQGKFGLSDYVDSTVLFRISVYKYNALALDASAEGFYFDDIYPVEFFDTSTVVTDTLTGTNYTFGTKDAGLYHYRVRAIDGEDQYGLFSEPIRVITYEDYLCGDVDSSGSVDTLDLDYLVNYLFIMLDPPPNPMESGNMDCSPGVTMGDLTVLISYLHINDDHVPCYCEYYADKPAIMSTSVNTKVEYGTTRLFLDTDVPVKAILLEFEDELPSFIEPHYKMDVIKSSRSGGKQIALVDLKGQTTIGQGNHEFLAIQGEHNLISATVVNKYHDSYLATIGEEGTTLPTKYELGQCYPNPFNPITHIVYSLPNAGHVTLEVFNVLGQQVKTLVDEHREAGMHEVEFDASGISSGIYFYRITADQFTDSKKMVLMK